MLLPGSFTVPLLESVLLALELLPAVGRPIPPAASSKLWVPSGRSSEACRFRFLPIIGDELPLACSLPSRASVLGGWTDPARSRGT